MKLTNRTYNVLKNVALLYLPLLATFYFTMAGFWGLSHTTEVVGTLSALDTFLGAALKLSTADYNFKKSTDGQVVVDKSNPVKETYTLDLNIHPSEIATKDQLVLNVTKAAPAA